MLVRAFGAAVLCAMIVAAALASALAAARAATYHRAEAALAFGYTAALQALVARLAAAVEANTSPPATLDLAKTCAGSEVPCRLFTNASVTLTTTAAPAAGNACGSADTNCAQNLQPHPLVGEGRVAARIDTSVVAASGEVLVTRHRFVTLRTFEVAPYVAVVGQRDGDDGAATSLPEGEDAGAPGSADVDDTRIHVRYFNAASGTYDAGEVVDWSTRGWSNGNGNASGWSR